jgi:hypothetical protein
VQQLLARRLFEKKTKILVVYSFVMLRKKLLAIPSECFFDPDLRSSFCKWELAAAVTKIIYQTLVVNETVCLTVCCCCFGIARNISQIGQMKMVYL